MKTMTRSPIVSLHSAFKLFDGACGASGNEKTAKAVSYLCSNVGNLPGQPFEAANVATNRLLEKGWRYGLQTYRLADMLLHKAGNCLGLSCLYGALLESRGFKPEYELVVGPKGYQSIEEQELLDFMLCGQAFPFHSPVLPLRSESGEKLLFCTQEHPRLVLNGERFETTTLKEQGPSEISGERTRKLDYNGLMSLIFYERAHGARVQGRIGEAKELLKESLGWDLENHSVYGEFAELSLSVFDDESFYEASEKLLASPQKDSKFWLQRYSFFGDMSDLENALKTNPTDMCAWPIKHVLCEKDKQSQRANFAIAAQCVARSEILNLGSFYATHSPVLAKLFPDDAVSLVRKSQDKATNPFEYHLALALLGSCKGVKWKGRQAPCAHLAELEKYSFTLSPFQKTRLLYAGKRLSGNSVKWQEHCVKFDGRKTFKATVDLMDRQWQIL